ncbi:non-canonical purine NTP pyrophosphatase [Croceivirga lutea]|uniref:non-canonical purine NTP diphosphatase n=1 Tax=Croceivirga lutea TaxID=1775167 RepID=UPI001639A719|nr:non-canonical purine NTP diphosphatase [Croceivirga lutea]GGG47322.1 non-canonical purine NTP pyrophosphatase [Croceivirga lutea]
MKLVFATHNKNKFKEVSALLSSKFELLSLTDIKCFDEIPETGTTLQENAKLKTDFVKKNFNLDCFSDDTGLLVDALNGEPGVYSARYAGEDKSDEANITKLLASLELNPNRNAHFKTVVSLNINNQQYYFKGIVEGVITTKKSGSKGFGYDPIFIPNGYNKTFAELALSVKNSISHRGQAIAKLVEFLNTSSYTNN